MSLPKMLACELGIVGCGMAGMSAALFAAGRGLSSVLVGMTGEIIFASGLLDLMAVHPLKSGKLWDDPWAAIAALVHDHPAHPYARLVPSAINAAMEEVVAFLEAEGLPYRGYAQRNATVLTAIGTTKTTYRVPLTMWGAAAALESRAPCLVIGIQGLKGFSSRQIAAVQAARWPGLKAATIAFPDLGVGSEVFPERLARALENAENRRRFAAALRPHATQTTWVGLPAVLGVHRSAEVARDIEAQIGCSVFEIPTMPPGTTGLRLKEAFERGLAARKVQVLFEHRVYRAVAAPGGGFLLEAGRREPEVGIRCDAVLLATGRFMGGGLQAERAGLREALFNLPVSQPDRRDQWHREEFLDRRGHPVNLAGLETDEALRPLDASGRPAHPRLFAAGSILAHQDWMRMKCGSGVAIATAYAAIENARAELGGG